MKYIKTTFLVILLVTFQAFALESLLSDSGSGSSQEYVEFDAPPLFLLKADEAAKLRDIVAAAPYDKAYKTLIANADAVLGDKPQPLKEIIYGGRVSNHPDRLNSVRHLQDMNKIYTLTWACFVSGKSKYGTKAIEFVEAWAKKCKPSGNDVNDNKLLTCMVAYQMLSKEMSKEQKKTIGNWVKSIGDAQQKGWSDNKRGNHAGKRLKLIYFAAYLENDKDRIKWVQGKIPVVWNSTLFENGQTYDFKRRDALSYHFSTVRAFLQVAHIGRLAGKDHYNQQADNGGSIVRSIDFALPFIKGEKIHPEWVNTKSKLDKERWAKAGDPYYKPGKPWDPWEGYKSLMLASPFDKSLHRLAEKLRQDKNKPLPWFAVLSIAAQAEEPGTPNTVNTGRWSREKANEWYSRQAWPCGFNYIPANAISYTEMWMPYCFDAKLIDKELAMAEGVGFNCLRVILPFVVWEHDPKEFKKRLNTFLDVCDKRGIKVMLTFFDDCAFGDDEKLKDPWYGKQPEVLKGWFANGWTPSPGHSMVRDPKTWPRLEKYVKDIIASFKDDPRVWVWDLYNEPTNGRLGNTSLPLLTRVLVWAREIGPSQPLTVGQWNGNKKLNAIVFANSDIITFHEYGNAGKVAEHIESLKSHSRPIINTEWLKRDRGPVVKTCLPVFRKENVGCMHWGLVNGKTQTNLGWGWRPGRPEPKEWQHDLYRGDHTPYDEDEIAQFRKHILLSKTQKK